ncbi:MAG: HepT-like ribonuclease domain-containing protein [Dongiaceae bacterium]
MSATAILKQHIADIRLLLSGKSFEQVKYNIHTRAAFERFLERASDVSRQLPKASKRKHANVPWRRVAVVGDAIHFGYSHVDLKALWDFYERDLLPLERAVDSMLTAEATKDGST